MSMDVMDHKQYRSQFSFKSNMGIIWSVFIQRMTQIMRYKGALFFDIITPLLFAIFPIFIGVSATGSIDNASLQFQKSVNSESASFVLYAVLGANVFQIVNGALFNFGFFLRREQITGTLESLYLAPTNQVYVMYGTGLYAIVRAFINFVISLVLAAVLFKANPFTDPISVVYSLLFLLIGMLPLYGLAFGFGALVVKFKDMQSLQGVISNLIGVAMGIFFPITLLPSYIRFLSYILPPTWQNAGVRSILVGTDWILGNWYLDLAVLIAMSLFYPVIGSKIYSLTDRSIRKTQGLGVF